MLLISGAGSTSPAPEPSGGEALLRRLEERLAGLDSLRASFRQAFRSAATGVSVEERGRLFVARPRLRFDYRRPDKKVFLVDADGTTLAYVPADRTAVRSRLPDEALHLRLLRGESDLARDFHVREVSLKEPAVPGTRHLKLVPRQPDAAIDTLYLEVAPDPPMVRRVLVVDPSRNESDLVLEDVRINPELGAEVFRVSIPSGVEIRDLGSGGGG
jgi:outer membrane lipoprotein-sorting protein